MAKLSIYVPDELWEAVKDSTDEDTSPSQFVQRALRRYIGATDDLPVHLAGAVPSNHAELEEVRQAMRAEAREVFLEGYEIGIELARTMRWDLLDRMSEYDFDWEAAEQDPANELISPPEGAEENWQGWVDYLLTRQDMLEGAAGIPQRRGKTQQLGIRRAFRDIWEGVRLDKDSQQESISLEEE